MQIDTKYININGFNMAYLEKGEGDLIIFLHGFPDDALTFKNQIDFFSNKGYRVVAPYMRGYFPSEVPKDEKYYTVTLGKDVIELIKALGAQKAILVGHDWGASAAYAASLLEPEMIEKVIASSVVRGTFSKALVTNPEQQRKSWYIYFFQMQMAEMAVSFNSFAFIKRLWSDWIADENNIPREHLDEVIETFKQPNVAKAAISYYRCFFDSSKLSEKEISEQKRISSEKIDVPTLYLHGAEDGCIGVELCEGVESYFGDKFSKKIISGAGHFIHLEKPNEFNEQVFKFIESK